MKRCQTCERMLSRENDFYVNGGKCKECLRRYNIERYRTRRTDPTCKACGTPFARRPGRGQQPALCGPCRSDESRITTCAACGIGKPRTAYGSKQANICKLCFSERYRDTHRKLVLRQHGLTLDDYAGMFDRQHGQCAICTRRGPAGRRGTLDVDHSHRSGAVRGLLCPRCNTGLGLLGDDTLIVASALGYLHSGGPHFRRVEYSVVSL
jgi:hypothetical protein